MGRYTVEFDIERIEKKEKILEDVEVIVKGDGEVSIINKDNRTIASVGIEFGEIKDTEDKPPSLYVSYYGSYKQLSKFFCSLPKDILEFIDDTSRKVAKELMKKPPGVYIRKFTI